MNLKDEIVAGESYALEFKRAPNEDREKYLKAVVAFANGKGGRILFGVANDRMGCYFKGAFRHDRYELPPDEMRELVINAFAHRSYLEHDAPVFLAIYDNRVEITSPGGLPRGQTVDRALAGYSKIRNDVLAKVLNYMRYIEEWGSGLRRVNRVLAEYGIRPVAVDEAAFATQMNVYRVTDPDNEGNREGNEGNNEGNDPNGTDDGTNGGTNDPNRERNPKRISGAGAPVTAPLTAPVNEPVNEPVTSAAKLLLRIIRENPGKRKQELVALTGLRPWTVKRLLEGMLRGNVEYRGACRNGGYFVVDENLKA